MVVSVAEWLPLDDVEVFVLESLARPAAGDECPCPCGEGAAIIVHLATLLSRKRGFAVRIPEPSAVQANLNWRTTDTPSFTQRCTFLDDSGNEPMPGPWELPGLWLLDKCSYDDMNIALARLRDRALVQIVGGVAEITSQGRSVWTSLMEPPRRGGASEGTPDGAAVASIEAAPQFLDMDEKGRLTMEGEPLTYVHGKHTRGPKKGLIKRVGLTIRPGTPGAVLVDWIRQGARPALASSKAISYLRDALRDRPVKIGGEGAEARLTAPVKLSRGLESALLDARRRANNNRGMAP